MTDTSIPEPLSLNLAAAETVDDTDWTALLAVVGRLTEVVDTDGS